MSYPKPLSQKNIDKLLSAWDKHTADVLHKYYEAFASLYGIVMLDDAWKVFKKFEPKIHKKQFVDFSAVARRENVPYYVFEADEIFSEEKRIDVHRFIVDRSIVFSGYYKFNWLYEIVDRQQYKPLYDKPDLLTVAAHPYHDEKLRPLIDNMKFGSGKYKGKKFSECFMPALDDTYGQIPFSQQLFDHIVYLTENSGDMLGDTFDYLEWKGFQFEHVEEAKNFVAVLSDFVNNSHLKINRGFTPVQLSARQPSKTPPTISFGEGMKKAFKEGSIDREEVIKKLIEMGLYVDDN